MRGVKRSALAAAMAVVAAVAAGAWAPQAPPKTPTDFYLSYLAAMEKAKKVEDLVPFMTAEHRKQMESTPAEQRGPFFEMIKMMRPSKVKVVKETAQADGSVIIAAEGVDADNKKAAGKITIVKEGGAWKISEESWSS
jgi:hypothetical protein